MSFAEDFAEEMNTELTVEPWTGQDGFGDETYGAAVKWECYFHQSLQQVLDREGKERLSSAMAIGPPAGLKDEDRFTIPSTFEGPSQPEILRIDTPTDEDGAQSHHEVYFK